MINLTNHSCSHCQHLDRYKRTHHGHMAERVRKMQQELEYFKNTRQFSFLRGIQEDIDYTMRLMKNLENGNKTHRWDKYYYMNRRG